jgi:hypothetical protein
MGNRKEASGRFIHKSRASGLYLNIKGSALYQLKAPAEWEIRSIAGKKPYLI